MSRWLLVTFCLVFLLSSSCLIAQEDRLMPGDVERARSMLSDVNDAIKNHYYDPKFHGLDLQARYKDALAKINGAKNLNQMLGIIAWFMEGLNDSHSFFIPPPHAYKIDYGWRAQVIGDHCFITQVKPGSDAEKQLKEGDQVLSINGLAPNRENLHQIEYIFGALRPQPALHLLVQHPQGKQENLEVRSEIKPTRREINIRNFWDEIREYESDIKIYKRRSAVIGDDIYVWKLPDFMMAEKGADNMVGDARNSHTIILDLRGNPGGSIDAVERMVAEFFDHDVKVADYVERKPLPIRPSVKGRNRYQGKLIVLIDSQSASASEIFARVMQLEHRATIIGDRSEGAVMVSEAFPMESGLDHTIYYGASVTVAQMLMKDGTSLEKVGVQPDEVVLPTGEDLATHRDPALARAVELAGGKLSAEEAGKLFPYEWPPF